MLIPTKNTVSSKSLLAVTAFVAARVRRDRAISVEKLEGLIEKRFGVGARSYALRALGALYCINIIEYRRKTDMVEYVGRS